MTVEELFAEAIEDSLPLTEERLKKIEGTYFNGEEIKVGDTLLFAWIDEPGGNVARLKELTTRHFHLFEKSDFGSTGTLIPRIQYKKS